MITARTDRRSASLLLAFAMAVGCAAPAARPELPYAALLGDAGEAVVVPGQFGPSGPVRGVSDLVVQAAIGASFVDDLKFSRSAPGDPGSVATADLSTSPLFAVFVQKPLAGEDVAFGIEGGLLFNWWRDETAVRAIGSGQVLVSVDTSMFFTDLSIGPYVSAVLGNAVRLYAGAGPLLLFGDVDIESDVGPNSESAFGVGGYVRGGAEFAIGGDGFIGIGVRALAADLAFDGPDDVSVDGVQAMVTFTQSF